MKKIKIALLCGVAMFVVILSMAIAIFCIKCFIFGVSCNWSWNSREIFKASAFMGFMTIVAQYILGEIPPAKEGGND